MRSIAAEVYGGAFRSDPELIATHAQAMFGVTRLGYLLQLLAMTGWTSLPWLWSLRQPTLVLMGRDDPLVPPVNGRILARLIPNARLQMIDDGHLFMVTRPIETGWRSKHSSATNEANGRRSDDCSGYKVAPNTDPFLKCVPRYSLQKFAVASDRRRCCIALESASEHDLLAFA
jgi:hypothetical protein